MYKIHSTLFLTAFTSRIDKGETMRFMLCTIMLFLLFLPLCQTIPNPNIPTLICSAQAGGVQYRYRLVDAGCSRTNS